jgi:hypothetical protein
MCTAVCSTRFSGIGDQPGPDVPYGSDPGPALTARASRTHREGRNPFVVRHHPSGDTREGPRALQDVSRQTGRLHQGGHEAIIGYRSNAALSAGGSDEINHGAHSSRYFGHYESWRGPFYARGLPIKAHLQYYASQFEATELNGISYRTPRPDAEELEGADKDFFTRKASKFITHWMSANSLFDNDQKSAAPRDAMKLNQICQNIRARSLACSLRSLACWPLP